MSNDVSNDVSGSVVHGHVVQAGSIGTMHVHSGEVTYPPLTSWQDRPRLTSELEDLLQVQHDAAVTLPYHLLPKNQPELIQVYVQQAVLSPETEKDEADRKEQKQERKQETPRRIMPIEEALASGRHLLITGGPGSGKSTLGQMYVRRLAREWLEPGTQPPLPEPVMPVRINAKALADDRTWSELLADAVRDRRLTAPMRPELFAHRALGARWLVFVDGLDEIVEPDRLRQVIDAVAARMRRGTDHQLVITSRELPSGALDQLHGPHTDRYVIEPFGPAELREFAYAWFRAQELLPTATRAEEFLRQVHDGRLRELVNVPLLATITAIAHTLEPTRTLPHNRVDLFARFMTYLLDDKVSGRDVVAELRKSIYDPARLEVVEHVYERRRELVEHLAVQRLESERPLLQIAADWIGRPCPEDDLLAVLTSIGVFAQGDQGIDFLHRLFAEFLAARHHAPRIAADFPSLNDWVAQGTEPAKETFVLFTFVLWSREEGHDLGLVINRLLDGSQEHVMLAAKLLSEDVAVPAHLSSRILGRLVDLVLTTGAANDPWDNIRTVGRALAGLDGREITAELIARLRALQDNAELAPKIRICCATALGHLGAAEESARWLEEFGDLFDPLSLRAVTRGLAEILPNGSERAEFLVVRQAESVDEADYVLVMAAIQILLDLKRAEAATRLLRRLVSHMRSNDAITSGTRHVPEIHGDADDEPPGWDVLVSQAVAAECAEEALWAAGMVVATPAPDDHAFRLAVEAIVLFAGAAAPIIIVDDSETRSIEHKLIAAEVMRVTHPDAALNLARTVATSPIATDLDVVAACKLLALADPLMVHDLLMKGDSFDSDDIAMLAADLATTELDVADLVAKALARTYTDRNYFDRTARTLLELGDFGRQLHAAAMSGPSEYWRDAAPLLHMAGYDELSSELVDRLITEDAEAAELAQCLDSFEGSDLPAQAQRLLDRLMELAPVSKSSVLVDVALVLHRIGRGDEAVALAKDALIRELGGTDVEKCADALLEIAGAGAGDFIIAHVLDHGLSVDRRVAVADRFAARGLLDRAAAVWLDVVRDHGDQIATGVEIAAKLVRSGYQEQAVKAVQTGLSEDRLTATTRTNLKALLAWLNAMAAK